MYDINMKKAETKVALILELYAGHSYSGRLVRDEQTNRENEECRLHYQLDT